jgi:fructokinase
MRGGPGLLSADGNREDLYNAWQVSSSGAGDHRIPMTQLRPLLCGVELGGTKCVCLIGTGPGDILAQTAVPTGSDPDATLRQIAHSLRTWKEAYGPFDALGLASFGPLDLRAGSRSFGHIISTVKPGWGGIDVVGRLGRVHGVPVGFNTDVNSAALAESRWGHARELADFAYITVGTGVGVGLVVGGKPVFGCNHTELGHVRVARPPTDHWRGICRFHGDCVEGLASGPAIAARAGLSAEKIPDDSPVWELAADALAQLIHAMVLATAPRRILVGGGVVQARPQILVHVRRLLIKSLNGYLDLEELTGGVDRYIVPPGLGALAGPLGALALAADAYAMAQVLRATVL